MLSGVFIIGFLKFPLFQSYSAGCPAKLEFNNHSPDALYKKQSLS